MNVQAESFIILFGCIISNMGAQFMQKANRYDPAVKDGILR